MGHGNRAQRRSKRCWACGSKQRLPLACSTCPEVWLACAICGWVISRIDQAAA